MSAELVWEENGQERRIRQGHGCLQRVPTKMQEQWMRSFVAQRARLLLPDGTELAPGQPAFHLHLGFVSSRCGLIANLSLRENLLLPLLHHGGNIDEAWNEADRLAAEWGLAERLDQRTGSASAWEHAIASLLRCRLQRASFLLVNDAMQGLSAKERLSLREAFDRTVQALQAGWLWVAEEVAPEMPPCR